MSHQGYHSHRPHHHRSRIHRHVHHPVHHHVFNINKESEKYGNEKKNTLKINNGTKIYSVGNIYYIKVKKEI